MAGDYNRGGFKPPPRKKTFLDHPKLHLRAPNGTGNSFASLQWQLVNSNPRIVVWTNDPNDTIDYGKINANMDAPTLFALFRLIEKAIAAPGKFRDKIDNLNFTFNGGKRSDSPAVVSSTIISKDDAGLISLMISAPRRPQIKFDFINPDFHHFIHTDGSPFEKAEASQLFAEAYIDLLKHVFTQLMVTEYVEPPPREPKGGGGNNYGNRGGNERQSGGNRSAGNGGGGGGGRQEATVGDDLDDLGW